MLQVPSPTSIFAPHTYFVTAREAHPESFEWIDDHPCGHYAALHIREVISRFGLRLMLRAYTHASICIHTHTGHSACTATTHIHICHIQRRARAHTRDSRVNASVSCVCAYVRMTMLDFMCVIIWEYECMYMCIYHLCYVFMSVHGYMGVRVYGCYVQGCTGELSVMYMQFMTTNGATTPQLTLAFLTCGFHSPSFMSWAMTYAENEREMGVRL